MPNTDRKIVKSNPARLREIRKSLGWTQVRLATALGVRRNTLARWERGDPVPSRVVVLAAEYIVVEEYRLLIQSPKGT